MSNIVINIAKNNAKTIFEPLDKSFNVPTYSTVNIDYLGNIYLKHGESYYIVSIDKYSQSGVELTKIKSPDVFRKNLVDSEFLKTAIKSGTIKENAITLRGKVIETISDMNEEEIKDYMDKNEYMLNLNSLGCEEKRYFWVKYENLDECENGEYDDWFYINGAVNQMDIDNGSMSGMVYSDLLALTPGNFETFLIDGDIGSRHVISSSERIDGFVTAYLTIYTSGKMKANFIDTCKISQLCFDEISGELTTYETSNVMNAVE